MKTRRDFLSSLVAVSLASAAVPPLAWSAASQRRIPWTNWSGSQRCLPQARKAPNSLAELQQIIATAPGVVRPVGAGHSFMPLVPTDDTIVSLSRMAGVVAHNADKNQATILAGTRLGDIGDPLAARGQALKNMPDIDEQSLAGALGTATHGTGAELGCLSSFVQEIELVTASGDVLRCSADNKPDIFNAARVNLGTIGVVTEVVMENQPKYRLKRESSWLPIEDILQQAHSLADNNRNFEFYYIPFSGMGFIDLHNITDAQPSRTEEMDQNDGANTLKDVRDYLGWSDTVRELVLNSFMSGIKKEVVVANSWQNYAKERNVRFNEMEYHLPREAMIDAFKEVRKTVEDNFPEVFFPFEVRFIQSDDIWLSPFNGRETCSIAVHRFFEEDYKPLFKAIEPIFKKYGGRPHWGKLNTMAGAELSKLYPQWHDFNEVRRQLDPDGKFLNPYLQQLFL